MPHLRSGSPEIEVRCKLMFARYEVTGKFVTSAKATILYHNSARAFVDSPITQRAIRNSVYVYPNASKDPICNDDNMRLLADVASLKV